MIIILIIPLFLGVLKLKSLFKNLKITIVFLSVIFLIFFYFGVFNPLKNELEETLKNNFQDKVYSSELYLESSLNRFIDDSRVLSDRKLIKNKLEEYYFNKIDYQEIREYTQNKYSDASHSLKYLLSSYRFTNNKLIAHWGIDNLNFINKFNFSQNKNIEYKILDKNGYKLILKSPIINDKQIMLGKDFFIYSLEPIFRDINSGSIHYEVLNDKNKILSPTSGKIIKQRPLLNSNYWLKAQLSKDRLYNQLDGLTFKILLSFFILLLVVAFIVKISLDYTFTNVIEELEKEVQAKKKLSETDLMLGIHNRAKFIAILKNEINRANRYINNLSLIMFDIDYFKRINDNYGHNIGDDILIEAVNISKEIIRESDSLARYGGDEFMIICPQTKAVEAENLAERLRKNICKFSFSNNINITCSFGVTEFKNNEEDLDSLIKRVDDALYIAKDQGKNKVFRKSQM